MNRLWAPTCRAWCQYSGRLEPNCSTRPAVVPTVADGEVRSCQPCEIWPVSPREEAATPTTATITASPSRAISAQPIRRRTASGTVTRSIARAATKPAAATTSSTTRITIPNVWPAWSCAGSGIPSPFSAWWWSIQTLMTAPPTTPITSITIDRKRSGARASHSAIASAAAASAERE